MSDGAGEFVEILHQIPEVGCTGTYSECPFRWESTSDNVVLG